MKKKWCVMFEYQFNHPWRFISRHRTKQLAEKEASRIATQLFEDEKKKNISQSYRYLIHTVHEEEKP
jgi:hypothetical protein